MDFAESADETFAGPYLVLVNCSFSPGFLFKLSKYLLQIYTHGLQLGNIRSPIGIRESVVQVITSTSCYVTGNFTVIYFIDTMLVKAFSEFRSFLYRCMHTSTNKIAFASVSTKL